MVKQEDSSLCLCKYLLSNKQANFYLFTSRKPSCIRTSLMQFDSSNLTQAMVQTSLNQWFKPHSSNGSNLSQSMDGSNLNQAMVQTSLKQWMVRTTLKQWFEPNSSNGSNLTPAMLQTSLKQWMVRTSLKQWMVRTTLKQWFKPHAMVQWHLFEPNSIRYLILTHAILIDFGYFRTTDVIRSMIALLTMQYKFNVISYFLVEDSSHILILFLCE